MKNSICSKPPIQFLLIVSFALLLYLPFLSIQYDTNGLVEAQAVEQGPILNKNHMLYRPLALVLWRVLHAAGYIGNSLPVLQTVTAVAAALGVGFAFLAYRRLSENPVAALIGAVFLATSFTYWVSATDVFYVPVAGMFGAAALASLLYAKSDWSVVAASVLVALSTFTWQGSLFLLPALMVMFPEHLRKARSVALFASSTCLLIGGVYTIVAFHERGWMGPSGLWTWFTHYSENPTLSIWGIWELNRIPTAALSALDSVTAARLAAGLREIFGGVQLGRIAVDCSIVAFAALVIYAITKLRRGAFKALAAYFCFFPFIVWWDPGSHKWFLVANIFLTAFLVCGLTSRLHYKPARLAIVFCLLIIAGTNFITTIRPRHADRGRDNRIADCVAGHMRSKDLFVAAEWGWPDYLPYLHKRSMINIINEFAQFQNREKTLAGVRIAVDETRKEGGDTYMANPQGAFDFDWLNRTTGVTRKDLSSFGGAPSFVCYDVTIDRIN